MFDLIANAIFQTLHYADLFDYALTSEEIFRFLICVPCTREQVDGRLDDSPWLKDRIARTGGFVTLARRESLVAARAQGHAAAQRQMPRARQYARWLAHFPFVRMIGLTGGLAMENARDGDIDLLIVTVPGRLWLVRGMVVALVRFARVRGDRLCPNLLLTENALAIPQVDLYHAHEIIQMIPLYGMHVYQEMRRLNAWADAFLPNAVRPVGSDPPLHRIGALVKAISERALCGRIGELTERWERTRKIAKLSARISLGAKGAEFSEDVCRGFLSDHSARVLTDFYARVNGGRE